jgi:epoxyqueuosine reductase
MSEYSVKEITALIKEKARELGFDECGISKAEFLYDHEKPLNEWISKNKGYHTYLEKNTELRLDASRLFKNAKSVISLLKNYFPPTNQKGEYLIAKYAYGQDYHNVIKNKLFELVKYITTIIGKFEFNAFVDSAPILEKAYAVKAGLGQIGKNNLLITKQGSYFFLSEIIVDFELEYKNIPRKDICGKCTKCIDACPTNALYKEFHLDTSKCISALTIEYKDDIPECFKGKTMNWIYGCDICQDVCPYNKNPIPHNEPLFAPVKEIINYSKKDWINLSEEKFNKVFKKSSIKRIKHPKFISNIRFIS